MTAILAIDTSTEACSVALNLDGRLSEDFALLERRHAAEVLPMVRALMERHELGFTQLDAVAFGRGPGSFTGLRIAAGVAQGLAFGADLPVVPVSTLAALALQAARRFGAARVACCMDARIGELYWGYFLVGEHEMSLRQGEGLGAPGALPSPGGEGWFGAGSGWAFRDSMSAGLRAAVKEFDVTLLPRAGDMALLAADIFHRGGAVPAEQASPVYLRDKVTQQRQ